MQENIINAKWVGINWFAPKGYPNYSSVESVGIYSSLMYPIQVLRRPRRVCIRSPSLSSCTHSFSFSTFMLSFWRLSAPGPKACLLTARSASLHALYYCSHSCVVLLHSLLHSTLALTHAVYSCTHWCAHPCTHSCAHSCTLSLIDYPP